MAVEPIYSNNNDSIFQINNEKLLDELETYYSYVLDGSHLNLADPIAANVGFFNNSGKIWVDGPKIGRTVVYITRPNMNFRSKINILRCRAFNYIISSKLGITLARMLMYSPLAAKINYGGLSELNFRACGSLVCGNNYIKHSEGDVNSYPYDKMVGGIPIVETSEVTDYKFDDIRRKYVVDHGYVIDDTNFITLLTNTCTETSSAKDLNLDVEETEGDFAGNKLVYGSGLDESQGPGQITLTFDDLYGSPVMNLFIMWVYYIHYVTKGICTPEFDYIINRIIDYTCSIYIFMLDTDQKTILRWIKYGGAFPTSIPFGQILHTKEPNLQALSQIQIPFQYNFACPNDPIVLAEFNMLSEPAICERQQLYVELEEANKTESSTENNGENSKTPIYDRYFKGRNHTLTEEAALELMHRYPPIKCPDKLLHPKVDSKNVKKVTNVRGATPVSLYENVDGEPNRAGGNGNYIYGNHSNYFDSPRLANRYYGMQDPRRNVGQPYIVAGNKLMFI